MFAFLKNAPERHFMDGGRVPCPRQGRDVEVDVCAGCRWLDRIDVNAKLPFVRCSPPAEPLSLE